MRRERSEHFYRYDSENDKTSFVLQKSSFCAYLQTCAHCWQLVPSSKWPSERRSHIQSSPNLFIPQANSGVLLGPRPWNPAVCSVRWTVCTETLPPAEPRFTRMTLMVILGFFFTSLTILSHFWLLTTSSEIFHGTDRFVFFSNTLHGSHWNLKTFRFGLIALSWLVHSHRPSVSSFVLVMTAHKPTAESCCFSPVELIKTAVPNESG